MAPDKEQKTEEDLDAELLALADSEDEESGHEEEGEATAPGSPASVASQASQGSVAMDESDSDAEGEIDDTVEPDALDPDDPFPVEGLFQSEKEKARIMAMPQIQREQLLADRAEEHTKRQQEISLRKMMQEHAAVPDKKRKAAAANIDGEDTRKSARPKVRATNEKLENYKKARENRGREQAKRQQRRGITDRGSGSPRSRKSISEDRDADGESDGSFGASAKEDPPAELVDFNSCRIGRAGFAEVMFYPGFKEAVMGCYMRFNVGPDPETGNLTYRMLEIKGE
jgi:RNA polymerase-associated protein RTF1